MQVTVDRRLRNLVVLHQCADEHALLAPLLKLGDLRWCELLAAAEHHTTGLGELGAVHLALGLQLRRKLGDGAKRAQEQPARRVVVWICWSSTCR